MYSLTNTHSLTFTCIHSPTHTLILSYSLAHSLQTHAWIYTHTHPHTHLHTLSLTHTLTHTLTYTSCHSHTHSPTHPVTHTHTHPHTHLHTLSLTHTLTHTLTLIHILTHTHTPHWNILPPSQYLRHVTPTTEAAVRTAPPVLTTATLTVRVCPAISWTLMVSLVWVSLYWCIPYVRMYMYVCMYSTCILCIVYILHVCTLKKYTHNCT